MPGARCCKRFEIGISASSVGLIILGGQSIQGLVRRDPRVDCAAEKNDGRESHGGSQKQVERKIGNVTKRWT